jgi:phage-related protein
MQENIKFIEMVLRELKAFNDDRVGPCWDLIKAELAKVQDLNKDKYEKTPEEVIKVVRELNEEMENEDISESFFFVAHTDGNCSVIEFIGSDLWNSEDDDREFFEDKNEWEPLVNYIRRKRDELLSNIIKHQKLRI